MRGHNPRHDARRDARRDDQYSRCVGKERFTTLAMAERVAKLSMERREGAKRSAYKCPTCGGFHVGSSLGLSSDAEYKRFRERLRIEDGDGMEFA